MRDASSGFPIPFLDRMRTSYFFVFLFLFQLLFIFQGLDFSDEGFHSTFYQQIFKDPKSVEYNFMFWLSGIAGGFWLRLFPEYGLLGLRFGGLLLTMASIGVSYNLLKGHLRVRYLKLGLFLLVLLNCAAVKDLSYNNLSAFLFVSALSFFFHALKTDRNLYFLATGVFLALTAFTRLSNVTSLSLAVVIVYSGFFIVRRTIPVQIKQIILLCTGFLLTVLVLLAIMKSTGQYEPFTGSLKLLKSIGSSKENTHGAWKLVNVLFRDFSSALFKDFLPLALLAGVGGSLLTHFKDDEIISKGLRYLFPVVFLASLLLLLEIKGTLTIWTFFVLLFAACSVVATLALLTRKHGQSLKILSLTGIIMLVSLVAGSDYGIAASGCTAMWVSVPIATDFLLGIFSVSLKGSLISRDGSGTISLPRFLNLSISESQMRRIWSWAIPACVILLVIHSLFFTYNDHPNRLKMTASVNNAFLRGIFTTPERAKAVNELLSACSAYIKPNDYVIAYKDIPMFYTLTRTRPYIQNSWPGILDKTSFAMAMHTASIEKTGLPVVIYQKVQTLPGPYWPTPAPADSALNLNQPENTTIRTFLDANRYHLVWQNNAFQMYIPGNQNLTQTPN